MNSVPPELIHVLQGTAIAGGFLIVYGIIRALLDKRTPAPRPTTKQYDWRSDRYLPGGVPVELFPVEEEIK